MIEVFKTNVADEDLADQLVEQIQRCFVGYTANFDLEDCDNILRVKTASGMVESDLLIFLLKKLGCDAEILEDEVKELAAVY